MLREKINLKSIILDMFAVLVGCILFSASVVVFTAPNQIAPGGVTGLSTVINHLTGAPLGVLILILNIPLFIGVYRISTKSFILKTLIAVILTSLLVEVMGFFLPIYTGDKLLSSLFAGALMGLGLGIMYVRGIMSGGSDLIAKILKYWIPYLPIGKLLFIVDAIIVILSAIVFKSLESGLYSAVVIFVCSHTIDTVISGVEHAKTVYIISNKSEEIKNTIFLELGRGVTALNGYGGYTNSPIHVLLCVVRLEEAPKLKQLVTNIDQSAFIITCDASTVHGEGFMNSKI